MTKYEWIESLSRYIDDKYGLTIRMKLDFEDENEKNLYIEIYRKGREVYWDCLSPDIDFDDFKKKVYKAVNSTLEIYG